MDCRRGRVGNVVAPALTPLVVLVAAFAAWVGAIAVIAVAGPIWLMAIPGAIAVAVAAIAYCEVKDASR